MLNHQKRTIKENRMSVEEVQLCLQEVNESIESQKEVDKVLGLGAVWNTAKVEPGSIVAVFGFGTIGLAVFNFSTGRIINKTIFDSEVTSMDHDHTGQLIFCGDGQGCIYTVKMNSHTGTLSRSHRNRSASKRKSPITTVQYRTFSLLARGPVLLSLTRDGSLSFFSVSLEIQGYLTLRCSLKLAPRLHSIRASFCPLLSLEKGEYIVAGSEDANVYFYDLTRPKHTCVNKLQGHGYAVIGIAWNHGENLLASSDFGGTVIVWKRAKTN